ncbi:GMP synthase [Nitrospira sp.]|nr:GMP synthase [Nitrospira sp.]
MSRRAVCLKHVPFEGPGAFATSLYTRGITLERYLVPSDGLPKDAGELLIVMGGPMSVNDATQWMAEETVFIRKAIDGGTPVLGICLGSQLMAKALGASVLKGHALEIGMTQITVTPEGRQDPFFRSCPERFSVFQWHGEVFDLPVGAVPLAGSNVAPLQAFRFGPFAYGLLFHLEMDEPGITALCRECASGLAAAKTTASEVMERARPCLPQLHVYADRLIAHLLTALH